MISGLSELNGRREVYTAATPLFAKAQGRANTEDARLKRIHHETAQRPIGELCFYIILYFKKRTYGVVFIIFLLTDMVLVCYHPSQP